MEESCSLSLHFNIMFSLRNS
jgi:hypothetical protein